MFNFFCNGKFFWTYVKADIKIKEMLKMLNIEQELKEMDFSGMSKVKDSLFKQLMLERTSRIEIDEEDLEFLAAAGNTFKPEDKDRK